MPAVLRGFPDPVRDAQVAFRAVLRSLAEPTTQQLIDVDVPDLGLGVAAVAVMLSLADIDTPCWTSAGVTPDARDYFRFHTGTRFVDDPSAAALALVASVDELPPLGCFASGTVLSPETSTTVIVVVDGFDSDVATVLDGPGFDAPRRFAPRGFEGRWDEVAANHRLFPCGVDVVFAHGATVVGLPRSTSIAAVA